MAERQTLERECTTLTRYLVGAPAPAPCLAAYLRAHVGAPDRGPGAFADAPSAALIDRWTVWLGRRGGVATRLADAYCTLFRRGGPLRRKVTLALALLEHAPPHHGALHAGSGTGTIRTWGGLTATAVSYTHLTLPTITSGCRSRWAPCR